jgi:hypothetical protein
LLWDGLSGRWPLDELAGRTAEDRNLPRTIAWNRNVGLQLLEHYIGGDFDRLEEEYLGYCRRVVRGVSVVWDEEPTYVSVAP